MCGSPGESSQTAYSSSGSWRCSGPPSGTCPNSREKDASACSGGSRQLDHPVERRGEPGPVGAGLAVDQEGIGAGSEECRSARAARAGSDVGSHSAESRRTHTPLAWLALTSASYHQSAELPPRRLRIELRRYSRITRGELGRRLGRSESRVRHRRRPDCPGTRACGRSSRGQREITNEQDRRRGDAPARCRRGRTRDVAGLGRGEVVATGDSFPIATAELTTNRRDASTAIRSESPIGCRSTGRVD